jgi:xylan 1,4-beta-xylosidase
VLNIFRMFARLGTTRLAARSDAQLPLDSVMRDGVRGPADIGTIATRTTDGKVAILLWHYHDDDVAGTAAKVALTVQGLTGGKPVRATLWRVDDAHGNAYAAWQKMGSPRNPDIAQYDALQAASAMQPEAQTMTAAGAGRMTTALELPRQGVALLVLEN